MSIEQLVPTIEQHYQCVGVCVCMCAYLYVCASLCSYLCATVWMRASRYVYLCMCVHTCVSFSFLSHRSGFRYFSLSLFLSFSLSLFPSFSLSLFLSFSLSLFGFPVLLIVTHAGDDSCTLYLVDCSAWPIFRELLCCSIPCLQEHLVIVVF